VVQLDGPDTVYPTLHIGKHAAPDARLDVQSPLSPFVGATDASHGFGMHVAAVNSPAKQLDGPDTVYPALQVGWHVKPEARAALQLFLFPFPFDGLAVASHGSGLHVAAVSVRVVQLVWPDTVYPLLHVGRQIDPDSRIDVQVPLSPFLGLADASHDFGMHVAAVNSPAKQLDGPDTVYPALQVGWHVDPDTRLFVQLPLSPFAGAVDASHGSGLHLAAVTTAA
jgi:hypothetical protein